MDKLPAISGKDLVKVLNRIGFVVARTKGSHVRLKHQDGRVTTVPIHRGADLPKGLLRKIIREDIKLIMEEFIKICKGKS